MVIEDDIQSEGKLFTEIFSLSASFEREVVGVLPFLPWGFKVNAAGDENCLGLDCPHVDLQSL